MLKGLLAMGNNYQQMQIIRGGNRVEHNALNIAYSKHINC